MAKKIDAAAQLFAPKGADKLYGAIGSRARAKIGAQRFVEDPKQTCVHITAGKGGIAYAGLHPRKNALLLNIRLHAPLESDRVLVIGAQTGPTPGCELPVK